MVAKTEMELLKDSILAMKDSLSAGLMSSAEAEKFLSIAANHIDGKQKLLECNRPSLFAEITKAAQLKLYLDGQEASLVPFKGTVKLLVGYKGLLKLVRNSGELASINAGVVYEKDQFDFFVDEKGEHIVHRPTWGKDRGKPVHTYCIARMKNSDEPYVEIMTEEEVQSCRKQSRAGDESPWNGPFADEMRKKTAIRRISKRLPMSTDFQMAINADDEFADPLDPESPPPEKTKKSSKLEKAVGAEAPEQTAQPAPAAAPAPAATPVPAKPIASPEQVAAVEKEFTQTIEGYIANFTVRDNPDGPEGKKRRYALLMGGQFHGTWDQEVYKKFIKMFDSKAKVLVKFVEKLNAQKQPYRDIIEISEVIPAEEVPI